MIVKRANIRRPPSRIATWTKSELVVLWRDQLPYPHIAISPTRRDEVVSPTTRRCPGYRRYRRCGFFFRIGLASRRQGEYRDGDLGREELDNLREASGQRGKGDDYIRTFTVPVAPAVTAHNSP